MIALQVRYSNKKASESTADQPAENRNGQTVAEIRSTFTGDGEECVSDPRTQVPRRINRESGSAAQAGADGPHHRANQERNQSRRWRRFYDGGNR